MPLSTVDAAAGNRHSVTPRHICGGSRHGDEAQAMDRLKAKHIVIGVVGLVALFLVINLALANSVG